MRANICQITYESQSAAVQNINTAATVYVLLASSVTMKETLQAQSTIEYKRLNTLITIMITFHYRGFIQLQQNSTMAKIVLQEVLYSAFITNSLSQTVHNSTLRLEGSVCIKANQYCLQNHCSQPFHTTLLSKNTILLLPESRYPKQIATLPLATTKCLHLLRHH